MAFRAALLFLLPIVVGVVVLAVTIYEHVSGIQLSLPFAPTLSAFTIVLPIIAVANALYLAASRHQRERALTRTGRRPPSLAWTDRQYYNVRLPSVTAVLQVLQGIITAATATLLVVNNIAGGAGASSPLLRCVLETTWQRLYSQHNAAAMRRIQDALNCCGFNSVVDRAWPFPSGSEGATCAASYGRTTPCREPWMQATRQRAGVELTIVLLVALFQAATILGRRRPWTAASVFGNVQEDDDAQPAIRRPLLTDNNSAAAGISAAAATAAADDDDSNGSNGTDATNSGRDNNDDGHVSSHSESSALRNAWANE